jgi:NAD(P)H-hydrate epimerase
MATAGSGDVLTGILTSLLAQGYTQKESCQIGVFIHGYAGDIAAQEKGYVGLIASDIIENIPAAFKKLYKEQFG